MKLSQILIPIFCLSLGTCSILGEKSIKPIISNLENNTHKIEVTTNYKYKMGDYNLDKQFVNFSAKKEGAYSIRVWKNCYRSMDRLTKELSFNVDRLPFSKDFELNSGIHQNDYHLQITYSDGKEIIISDLILPTIGYSASDLGYSPE